VSSYFLAFDTLMVEDERNLLPLCEQMIAQHPTEVNEFLRGRVRLLSYFVGQVMQKTNGKGNPQLISEITKKLLEHRATHHP